MLDKIVKQLTHHLDILILLVVSIFSAGMAYSSVSYSIINHESRITKLEVDHQGLRETAARIEQKVDDLKDVLQKGHR